MGIQLSGLASGLDWQTVISQLIAVQKIPLNNLQSQKSVNSSKISAYNTLKDNLTALKNSLSSISTSGIGASRSATITSGSTSGWNASASNGTAIGNYTFNVTQLATQTQRVGTSSISAGLNDTDDVSGITLATLKIATPVTAGSITVNGAKVDIELTDSLQDVFDKISAATGGTVTAAYSAAEDKVTLTSSDPILLGSGSDTSNFLTAFRLYNNGTGSVSSQRTLGAVNLDASIKEANLKGAIIEVNEDGDGILSLNGVTIAFNINTDSIRSLLQRISDSAAGVTATYDAVNDRFVLTNKATGNTGLSGEDSTGLLAAMGLATGSTLIAGNDAIFSVNGSGTLVSSSNTLTSAVHGVAGLSVEVTTTGTHTVRVTEETGSAKSAIENFIEKFNAVQNYISNQTKSSTSSDGKVTTSTLTGDLDLSNLASTLRGYAFATSNTGSSTIKRLADIGIDFNGTSNTLYIKDAAKLEAALKSEPDAVNRLFNDSSDSLVNRINTYVDRITATTGLIGVKTESLNRSNKDIDSQIARLNIQIAAEEARLKAAFQAMEEMQSKIQNQMSQLIAAFGG